VGRAIGNTLPLSPSPAEDHVVAALLDQERRLDLRRTGWRLSSRHVGAYTLVNRAMVDDVHGFQSVLSVAGHCSVGLRGT
jgi:hypothetical protein